jgi:hypothetical protein
MKQPSPSPLLGRARTVNRFGTDEKWYWASCDSEGWFWENTPGTPAVTLVVLESLRADLRLSWPDAFKAVRQLIQNPENPDTFPPASPAARRPDFPEDS